jgi:hypothetical protein
MPPESRTIRDDVVITQDPKTGLRVAFVLPVVPEDAPYRVREGLARRRITALSGTCPCGATAALDGKVMDTRHERGCSAATATLTKAIRRWAR